MQLHLPGRDRGRPDRARIPPRAEAFKQPYEQIRGAFVAQSAMHRLASEEEIARTALFLGSDLSDGITGQSLNVDCGSIMN